MGSQRSPRASQKPRGASDPAYGEGGGWSEKAFRQRLPPRDLSWHRKVWFEDPHWWDFFVHHGPAGMVTVREPHTVEWPDPGFQVFRDEETTALLPHVVPKGTGIRHLSCSIFVSAPVPQPWAGEAWEKSFNSQ